MHTMNCLRDSKASTPSTREKTGNGNATSLMLVTSRNGLPTLKVTALDGGDRLLHSSYDPLREARDLVNRYSFDGRGILVVLGLGLGYHVAELARRYPEARIIVIEALAECERLARQHETLDFDPERLTCLSGLTPTEALQRVAETQFQSGMPPLAMFALPAALAAFPGFYQPLRDKLAASIEFNLAGRLRQQKFQEKRTCVLLFDCNYFLTREVAGALEQMGHRVERLRFGKRTPVGELMGGLIKGIAAYRPDFCLTINHLGFDDEGTVSQFLRSIEMPAASWFVDSPDLIVKGFDKNISPFVSVFVWDSTYLASMQQAGFEEVCYLPLATDPEQFRPLSNNTPEVARLTASVGFVGNSMVENLKEKLAGVPRPLRSATEVLAKRLISHRTSLDELLSTLDTPEQLLLDRLETQERLYFDTAVTWQATLLYRLACVEQLRGFRPVIRGDKGWQTLLDRDFTLRPPLDYYRELPYFYNACTVNFNATSLQMGTAVNQRLFDVPACGAFLLTDHQESLEELFVEGEEVITYRDAAEIPGLVRFYLAHPAARQKVVDRGRDRVLQQHTYRHRLQSLMETMEKRYA